MTFFPSSDSEGAPTNFGTKANVTLQNTEIKLKKQKQDLNKFVVEEKKDRNLKKGTDGIITKKRKKEKGLRVQPRQSTQLSFMG